MALGMPSAMPMCVSKSARDGQIRRFFEDHHAFIEPSARSDPKRGQHDRHSKRASHDDPHSTHLSRHAEGRLPSFGPSSAASSAKPARPDAQSSAHTALRSRAASSGSAVVGPRMSMEVEPNVVLEQAAMSDDDVDDWDDALPSFRMEAPASSRTALSAAGPSDAAVAARPSRTASGEGEFERIRSITGHKPDARQQEMTGELTQKLEQRRRSMRQSGDEPTGSMQQPVVAAGSPSSSSEDSSK